MKLSILLVTLYTLLLCSCQTHKYVEEAPEESSYIVFLVEAPHLDYTSSQKLLKSLVKHPQTAQKDGYVGHAWFYLKSPYKELEGGHSGELGHTCPKYFDGIMNYYEYGTATPERPEQDPLPKEPNPIKYLWAELNDGFFQEGSGGHQPTTAAKFNLSAEQFKKIDTFLSENHYPFHKYSLTTHQCVTLITQLSSLIDHPLPSNIEIPIEPTLRLGKRYIRVWSDPTYSTLLLPSPDKLEQQLQEKIKGKHATDVLQWYLKKRSPLFKKKKAPFFVELFKKLPWRIERWYLYSKL